MVRQTDYAVTDVVIIGAGPVGLFGIFQCGMMRLRCHVVDALDHVGGQCSALYPEKPIYDIPAHPIVTAQGLIDHLHAQAAPFHPVYHLGVQVLGVTRCSEGDWVVELSNGLKIRSKVIMIAAGAGAFGPHRPPLENLELYEGKSVFYAVKSRDSFRNKRIVIAGGGDSAVDWALSLSEIAERVMLVHRRAKFRAAPETQARLQALKEQGRLDLVVPYQLERLEGKNGVLDAVVVKTLDGQEKSLEAHCLLPFFGLSMDLGPIATWGLALDRQHIVVDPSSCATNVSGIFAIGDVATYPHKLKLILTGFAEAAQAAHAARAIVYPGHVWHFEYSTTQGLPK